MRGRPCTFSSHRISSPSTNSPAVCRRSQNLGDAAGRAAWGAFLMTPSESRPSSGVTVPNLVVLVRAYV